MEDLLSKIKENFAGKLIKIEEKSARRIYLDLKPEDIFNAVKFLFKDSGCRFATASGIDTPAGFEILYHFSQDASGKMISLRTLITDKKNPCIQSIATLFPGAEWIEREMWELLGIDFAGHPDLKRLLLADEWPQGKYPLRHEQ